MRRFLSNKSGHASTTPIQPYAGGADAGGGEDERLRKSWLWVLLERAFNKRLPKFINLDFHIIGDFQFIYLLS